MTSWRQQVNSLGSADRERLIQSMTPKLSKYIPWTPPIQNPKQVAFLLTRKREVCYGGSAGGGKSDALLAGGLQYVEDLPIASLILRRTFRDLDKPGGLMFRAREWLSGTDAHWDGLNYRWLFPSGASLNFGYLEHEGDELRFQSSEYQYIAFDELTQFHETQYEYLFSRLRRLRGFSVDLRMRSATNPGGPGHEWVSRRFSPPKGPRNHPQRAFIFATLDDNPYLDQAEYEESLRLLGEDTLVYKQLRHGDWSATTSGGFFDPADFTIIPWSSVPSAHQVSRVLRYWDLAATERDGTNRNPDYTVGLKLAVTKRGLLDPLLPDYYILDIVRDRRDPGGVESLFRETCLRDGIGVTQFIEQERGSAGKALIHGFRDRVAPSGSRVLGWLPSGDKTVRARVPAGLARNGQMYIVDDDFTDSFLAEVGVFPNGGHDDQVDALSGAVANVPRADVTAGRGKGRQTADTRSRRRPHIPGRRGQARQL